MQAILVAAAILSVTSGQEYFREPEKIISDSRQVGDKLGQYSVAYQTDGGILQKEVGSRKYAGTADEAQLIQGSVQYNAPDGTPVSFSWSADEFGTQIHGTHIPTPPPIPPEIQRALDWLAKQPSTTEENYDDDDSSSTEAPAKESRPLEAEKKIVKDPKFRNQFRRN
ncbi:endocuticle structural glycoprotein SgAbd-4-like [Microplitis mediator]|uniref:endocuticle structural glycoprotein SgAbd-4-like n=1 Tax=Microplitis mediator TaxID=375433 RepID=UPI002557BDFF|nr:endocuticle structural glycoprotein SgAbd-4-like [Microplitis mediator]